MESDRFKSYQINSQTNQCFSKDEQKHYQEMFAQDVQTDRRRWNKTFLILFFCSIIYVLIGISLWAHPIAKAFWLIGLFVIPLPALTPVLLASAELKCPACRKNIFRSGLEVGNFCPECGVFGLKMEGVFASPYCEVCSKEFYESKYGRNYKIRACTYCGLLFSDEGY